jgi:hypothetical protein
VQAVSSVAPINAWAANVTNGLVKDVVPRGTQFGMIVANAVVFKGLWMYAFEKAATRKQSFTTGASKAGGGWWGRTLLAAVGACARRHLAPRTCTPPPANHRW